MNSEPAYADTLSTFMAKTIFIGVEKDLPDTLELPTRLSLIGLGHLLLLYGIYA